jgi:lipopolysaccharide biosynthesis regulator YciM
MITTLLIVVPVCLLIGWVVGSLLAKADTFQVIAVLAAVFVACISIGFYHLITGGTRR